MFVYKKGMTFSEYNTKNPLIKLVGISVAGTGLEPVTFGL